MEADVLTARQQKAIVALAAAKSAAAAAKVAGVSQDTLTKWQRQPAFKTALDQAQGERIAEFARELGALSRAAIAAFAAGLASDAPIHVRLRAADLVSRHLLSIRDSVTLEARIAALEAAHYAKS